MPALWEALAAVDWPMTLFLPATARKMDEVRRLPANITVKYYNLTPAEGWRWLMHRCTIRVSPCRGRATC